MAEENPFGDHAAVHESQIGVTRIGRDICLELRNDGLEVVYQHEDESATRWCGLLKREEPIRHVSYYNILNAVVEGNSLILKFVKAKTSKANSRLLVQNMIVTLSADDKHELWIEQLLRKAYPDGVQREKRIKLLINPFGGVGKARTIYQKHIRPVFEASRCTVDVQETERQGHAVEITKELDIDSWDVVACASGDGLPMECFNGLGQKANASEALKKIAVVQLPCGTGNAMSWNLNGTGEPTRAALAIIKGNRQPFDLASVTQGTSRTLSFLSQSLGIIAESDLGTDNIRWMGDFRFTWGFLVRLLGKTVYPIEYAVKTEIEGKEQIKEHYQQQRLYSKQLTAKNENGSGLPPLKYGTVNDTLPDDEGWSKMTDYPNLGNFYCGNMCYMAAAAPFFPTSLPNDGMLDLINIDGDISRLHAVKLLMAVEDGSLLDQDVVSLRKVSAIRVIPKWNKGFFSVDGESLPFEPFQIEVHPGLGMTLSRTPGVYEFAGPRDLTSSPSSASMTN